jgi:hypothetical protein
MGEANREAPDWIECDGPDGFQRGSQHEVYAAIAAFLIENSDDRIFLVGPVSWAPSDGTSARQWRFVVLTAKGGETRCDTVQTQDRMTAEAARVVVMAALIARRPCVVACFANAGEMVAQACAQWPRCDAIRRLQQAVDAARSKGMNDHG